MIKSFKLSVPQKTLNDIYSKVKKYPWKNMQNMDGWEHGTNYKYLKEISKYWITRFNWRKQEKKINSFDNFLTKVDGINIHFIKEKVILLHAIIFSGLLISFQAFQYFCFYYLLPTGSF